MANRIHLILLAAGAGITFFGILLMFAGHLYDAQVIGALPDNSSSQKRQFSTGGGSFTSGGSGGSSGQQGSGAAFSSATGGPLGLFSTAQPLYTVAFFLVSVFCGFVAIGNSSLSAHFAPVAGLFSTTTIIVCAFQLVGYFIVDAQVNRNSDTIPTAYRNQLGLFTAGLFFLILGQMCVLVVSVLVMKKGWDEGEIMSYSARQQQQQSQPTQKAQHQTQIEHIQHDEKRQEQP
ncbi:hypothetical protein PROFUN_06570 [Planoprotostelium fungivorum]|uniref:Uncharacterized protein n=1 Tax=Planoprotostelium fungivorum TaxID=1890364 RepID=A0A2P6MRV8_9EUKA|nr:hypothetical protein PROFUN_06570 [Planoprotostelium fungivorum]